MNFATNRSTILSSGIAFFLIGCMLGVAGMIVTYSYYPDVVMSKPTCECPELQEKYDQPRQLFSILGWGIAGIPIMIWKIKVNRDIDSEEYE